MKYLVLTALVIAIVVIIYFTFRKKGSSNIETTFVPSGLSKERITKLGLPLSPQQDLGILRESMVRFSNRKENDLDEDYRALRKIEWIVDIHVPENFTFKKEKFMEVFDYDWRKNYASEFYAHFPSTDKWSFAISADSPDEFDSLELAVKLAGVFDQEELSVIKLESYVRELKFRLNKFGVNFVVTPRESAQEACVRSAKLKKFQSGLQSELVVVLKSGKHFKALEFWNALVDVGLKWGDGDLFHWENYESGIGDDHFFDVWTSTPPGYFLPEEVAVNKCNPEDLIFGFSVPRSPDPERVFEMMTMAIEYCQKRLGGVLLDQNGLPFDKERYIRSIQHTRSKMDEQGLEVGQGATLRLF